MATNERLAKLADFLYWYAPYYTQANLPIKDRNVAISLRYFLRKKTQTYKEQRKTRTYEFPSETIREFRITNLGLTNHDPKEQFWVERINKTNWEILGDDEELAPKPTQLQERQHQLWLETNGAEYSFTGTYNKRKYRKQDDDFWNGKKSAKRIKHKVIRKA